MHRVSSKYLGAIAALYLGVGLIIGVYGTREYFLARGVLPPRQEPLVITYVPSDFEPTITRTPGPTPTLEPDQGNIEALPEVDPVTPVPEFVDVWENLDLSDGSATSFIVHTQNEGGSYATGEFWPWSYREGIFETSIFDPDAGGAVTWLDDFNRTILWVHSGPNHTMTALQRFIERDEFGNTLAFQFAEERIRRNLMNSPVQFFQTPDSEQWAWITAWARIPPDSVDAINGSVSDLPATLRAMYPNQGWEGFWSDTMIVFFCGRQLAGDPHDPDRPYWQQTRYIFGLLPGETPEQGGNDLMASRLTERTEQ